MNRKAQELAMAWRKAILEMHTARTQAEPWLTIEEIRRQCDGQLSPITVKRHLEWLRQHGYLRHDSSFCAGAGSGMTHLMAAGAQLTGDTKMAEKTGIDEMLEAVKGLCKGVSDRMDAMEAESKKDAKARADAAERAEREAADAAAAVAAKARADSAEDRRGFVDAQVRCDSAFQAWGKHAPHSVQNESVRDFRIRLLTELKQHSKAYKDSNLALIGDDAALGIIEQAIINDAIEASCAPGTHGQPLVARTKVDPATGHRITTFHGDPSIWFSELAGGSIMYGKLNQNMIDKATRAN